MQKNIYITTPAYYVNDRPHIGHAYTTLACDTLARFWRLNGVCVYLISGTDEHGQKVEQASLKEGVSPQAFTDHMSSYFINLLQEMDIICDDFIRTTEDRHKKAVSALWKCLQKRGYIYLGAYSGWYSVRDEAFYREKDLVDGKAPTGAPVEWVDEPSYFFKLSAFQEPLLAFYKNNPHFIFPQSRYNEVIRFVEGGLQDLSISRSTFSWGIPVPNDEKHIIYVWLDALTNYLSVLGFPDPSASLFQSFWKGAIHVVGKDILRFHAVYWPAFLMAAGLPLPKQIVAHGWWTNEGEKISKSLGNTIDPLELIQHSSRDSLRYFLLREISFGSDGNFSRQSFFYRHNNDLSNSYGNLAQRVLSFLQKNCEGKIPLAGELTPEDENLLDNFKGIISTLEHHMKNYAFHKYAETIWEIIIKANRYIDEQKPWDLKKKDLERMNTVLYVLLEVIRKIAILTQPLVPDASCKILDQLSVSKRTFKDLEIPLTPGTTLPAPFGVFPRLSE